jgi:hypothetical protein
MISRRAVGGRAEQAAAIVQIRLHDVHCAVRHHPLPAMQAEFLFAARHRDVQDVGLGLRAPQIIELSRLRKEAVAVGFHEFADADAFVQVVTAVGARRPRVCSDEALHVALSHYGVFWPVSRITLSPAGVGMDDSPRWS